MGQDMVISSETLDLTPVPSTAGWVLYRTDPTERSHICKAEWQRAGDLPEGHVPKVWWGGRGGDPSPPPYSQAPGPGPRALHQHSGSQGNSQKPPPYLRHLNTLPVSYPSTFLSLLVTTTFFSVSLCLFPFCYTHSFNFVDSTFKWEYRLFVFPCLNYFTKHNIL